MPSQTHDGVFADGQNGSMTTKINIFNGSRSREGYTVENGGQRKLKPKDINKDIKCASSSNVVLNNDKELTKDSVLRHPVFPVARMSPRSQHWTRSPVFQTCSYVLESSHVKRRNDGNMETENNKLQQFTKEWYD